MSKTKIIIIVGILLIVGFVIFNMNLKEKKSQLTGGSILNTDLPEIINNINKEESYLEFTGHALGKIKSHSGKFEKWKVELTVEKEKIEKIEAEIIANSVNTGIKDLDSHLKNEDFFVSKKYPKIKFSSESIKENKIIGKLTFREITKTIEFPINIEKNSITGETTIDISEFGINYFGVSKLVDIKFKIVMGN
ncbi:TPA: YceI family protein [Candidatus Pacearchaeota archaeon]|jgi:polyisoprenoid-binding protein YceI|nr:YceI family protein [Candidatus Pacearchaeota archaeon]